MSNPVSASSGLKALVAAAVAVGLAAGASAQQETSAQQEASVQERRERDREERKERIGPTMWRVRPRGTPYERWFEEAKKRIPTFEGLFIQDARTEPLKPWDDLGVDGLYVKMADYQITDGWILEIPPKGQTKPQRHLFESGIFFFGGPGHMIIQQEGKRPQQVEFNYRTLFSVPLNVRYQIFNDSDKPVRLMAVTSFPFVMNAMNSEKFVFENPFAFNDRYDAEEDYLRRSDHTRQNLTVTNLVPDALAFELDAYDHRGKGTTNTHWTMAGNSVIDLHVSEMPGGVYKKAHRHSSDAFILLLSGEGYSLTWAEGQYDKRVRVDWQEGTMFVPPIYWYHQHLNPGTESARYLAINAPPIVRKLGLRFQDQIEEDLPEIQEEWDREVAEHGGAQTQP